MEYLVLKPIPRTELTDYKDYINFIFKTENGVFNICRNEEDIIKSNTWFKNLPMKSIVVSNDTINIGDKFLLIANNQTMSGRIFTFINVKTDDLVTLKDDTGKELEINKIVFDDSYKFVRKANTTDKEKLINGEITPIHA